MKVHKGVQDTNEETSSRTSQANGKARKGGLITLEPGQKYLREALEIAMDYDIPTYDSLFLAQARELEAKINHNE